MPDKPEPKIFATKTQRIYLIFFLRALVPWWQNGKSFTTKSTKFTTKELKSSLTQKLGKIAIFVQALSSVRPETREIKACEKFYHRHIVDIPRIKF